MANLSHWLQPCITSNVKSVACIFLIDISFKSDYAYYKLSAEKRPTQSRRRREPFNLQVSYVGLRTV